MSHLDREKHHFFDYVIDSIEDEIKSGVSHYTIFKKNGRSVSWGFTPPTAPPVLQVEKHIKIKEEDGARMT